MIQPRCEGTRRSWRGGILKDRKCGRKARYVFQSYVGCCTTHYVCAGDDGCLASITAYAPNNLHKLG